MRNKILPTAVACITLLALAFTYNPTQARPASAAQTGCQTFKETGKTVCGAFLDYWNTHGGLAQQGYPISGEFKEVSDVDGKTYTVQYFERAEFELHTENKAPYNVLLSLLGSMRLKEKYPNGAPAPPTAHAPTGQFFPETGQYLGSPFLEYWQKNGGLAQQGYPISGQFSEKSDLNGQLYTVQYFERAVFEYHPEFDSLNQVLLTQLGTYRFKQKYPNGEPGANPTGTPLQVGSWGGDSIRMDVSANSVLIDFPCAHANINQAIRTASDGSFDVGGVYVQEHGGPTVIGDEQQRPARFTGTLTGTKLNVTITTTDDNAKVGSWTAVYGATPRLVKCM
jgi:hypothetical protein